MSRAGNAKWKTEMRTFHNLVCPNVIASDPRRIQIFFGFNPADADHFEQLAVRELEINLNQLWAALPPGQDRCQFIMEQRLQRTAAAKDLQPVSSVTLQLTVDHFYG
jgi:hypothetical protein